MAPRPSDQLLQETSTVPIVFPVAGDPVAADLVDSLARPGGNATGFQWVYLCVRASNQPMQATRSAAA